MKRIVVAGASAAGMSAARELRRCGFDGTIQLLDKDAAAPYRRPEVSKSILKGADPATIRSPWPNDLGLERLTIDLESADFGEQTVRGHDGSRTLTIPYDGLVIATGASARPLPLGRGLTGVHSLRSLSDGVAMRETLTNARRVVIIGGGFIGLEVASVCCELGLQVVVVEAADLPLRPALGQHLSAHLTALHRRRGVEFECRATVVGVDGSGGRVRTVLLADGRELPADAVLVSVGATPTVEWLSRTGIDTTSGISCDRTCTVEGAEGVVAAGDLASWYNPWFGTRMRVEHWTNAVEQGAYAARRLLGRHDPSGFASAPYVWSDQCGLRLQCVGSAAGADEEHEVNRDGERRLMAYGRAGRLIGVSALGMGRAFRHYVSLVGAQAPMDAALESLPVPS